MENTLGGNLLSKFDNISEIETNVLIFSVFRKESEITLSFRLIHLILLFVRLIFARKKVPLQLPGGSQSQIILVYSCESFGII